MKKFNKEKFIKKVNKIYQLEDELKNLESNLHDMYKEIDAESKVLANNKTKYNELINISIEKVKDYSQSELDEMIESLKYSPERIKKLENKRSKVFRKYQAIQNKIYKLRNSR
ncbi:hypothetical protein HDR59_02875 [bacterium]|nr:hypothetical protein [bacterium]